MKKRKLTEENKNNFQKFGEMAYEKGPLKGMMEDIAKDIEKNENLIQELNSKIDNLKK